MHGGADPDPTATRQPIASATATDGGQDPVDAVPDVPDAEPVVVTRPFLGAEVEVTAYPVEVSGDTAVLRTGYRVVSGDLSENLGFVLKGGGVRTLASAGGLRLVDADEKTVLPVALDSAGRAVASAGTLRLTTEEPLETLSVHAAPAGDTIDVLVPYFGYLADVPVIEASDDLGAVVDELGEPAELREHSLDSFSVSYDEVWSTRASGEEVTVTLSSGVLFAVDDDALSPQAAAVIDRAAEQITAGADGGEVRVVGHTDDVASEDYNQDLSERRAESVEVPGVGASTYRVSVDSVTRHGGLLVGSLLVERESGNASPMIGLFGKSAIGRAADRRFPLSELGAGSHNITVLGAESWIYPLDYAEGDRNRLMGEELLTPGPGGGESVLVTVVWSDPGTDTVTIDVPERFRITDVAVAER